MYNNEYNKKMLEYLSLYNFLYGDYEYDEEDIETLLNHLMVLKKVINYNYQSNILTISIKQRIYGYLNLCKKKIKDINQKKEIDRLLILLNFSKENKCNKFLRKQFILNYANIISPSRVVDSFINIKKYEQKISQALSFHLSFTLDLINPTLSIDEFVNKYLISSSAVISINYLLHCYPKIFFEDNVKNKIFNLLDNNQTFAIKYIDNSDKYEYEIGTAYYHVKTAKKIMRKIKKM